MHNMNLAIITDIFSSIIGGNSSPKGLGKDFSEFKSIGSNEFGEFFRSIIESGAVEINYPHTSNEHGNLIKHDFASLTIDGPHSASSLISSSNTLTESDSNKALISSILSNLKNMDALQFEYSKNDSNQTSQIESELAPLLSLGIIENIKYLLSNNPEQVKENIKEIINYIENSEFISSEHKKEILGFVKSFITNEIFSNKLKPGSSQVENILPQDAKIESTKLSKADFTLENREVRKFIAQELNNPDNKENIVVEKRVIDFVRSNLNEDSTKELTTNKIPLKSDSIIIEGEASESLSFSKLISTKENGFAQSDIVDKPIIQKTDVTSNEFKNSLGIITEGSELKKSINDVLKNSDSKISQSSFGKIENSEQIFNKPKLSKNNLHSAAPIKPENISIISEMSNTEDLNVMNKTEKITVDIPVGSVVKKVETALTPGQNDVVIKESHASNILIEPNINDKLIVNKSTESSNYNQIDIPGTEKIQTEIKNDNEYSKVEFKNISQIVSDNKTISKNINTERLGEILRNINTLIEAEIKLGSNNLHIHNISDNIKSNTSFPKRLNYNFNDVSPENVGSEKITLNDSFNINKLTELTKPQIKPSVSEPIKQLDAIVNNVHSDKLTLNHSVNINNLTDLTKPQTKPGVSEPIKQLDTIVKVVNSIIDIEVSKITEIIKPEIKTLFNFKISTDVSGVSNQNPSVSQPKLSQIFNNVAKTTMDVTLKFEQSALQKNNNSPINIKIDSDVQTKTNPIKEIEQFAKYSNPKISDKFSEAAIKPDFDNISNANSENDKLLNNVLKSAPKEIQTNTLKSILPTESFSNSIPNIEHAIDSSPVEKNTKKKIVSDESVIQKNTNNEIPHVQRPYTYKEVDQSENVPLNLSGTDIKIKNNNKNESLQIDSPEIPKRIAGRVDKNHKAIEHESTLSKIQHDENRADSVKVKGIPDSKAFGDEPGLKDEQNQKEEKFSNKENNKLHNIEQRKESEITPAGDKSASKSEFVKTLENLNPKNIQKTEKNSAPSEPIRYMTFQKVKPDKVPGLINDIITQNGSNYSGTARLILTPKVLGTIFVEIITKDDTVKLKLTAENPDAVRQIENNIGFLRDKIEQNGIKIENLIVNHYADEQRKESAAQKEKKSERGRKSGKSFDLDALSEENEITSTPRKVRSNYNQGTYVEQYI